MSERLAGRYELLRRLGAGGMGEVFLARDLTTGTECALKILRPRGATMPAAELTRREFEALTRLRHPAVVAVHELGFAPDGTPYFTMEYVPGLAADRALARGDWPSFFFVAAQVAHGLEALHGAGVVHGDVKPSNLLVVPGPTPGDRPLGVRLLDFGLAAVLGREGPSHRGTAGFAAPEMVRGAAPSTAADLYGLGATLYTLVAGRRPFEADRPSSLLRRQQSGPPPALPLEEAGAPSALVQLVLRLLDPDGTQRPRDAREVRRELERMHPAARRPLAERLRSEVLVGRERELARLERWTRPGGGRVRVMLVHGEAGAGKTALLAELAARAALEGRRVARLDCGALAGSGAAALVLLRRWAAEAKADPATLAVTSAATREAIAGAAGTFPEAELGMLADAAVAWTRDAGAAALPRLVLLDDGDRLDPLSRAFIRRLVLHPDGGSLRWVLARRSAAATGAPVEDEEVLREAGIAEVLTLGSLDAASAGRLAAVRLNQPAPEPLVSFLWSRAAGHAGLTVEMLRGAAESGALRESDAGVVVDPAALESVRTPPRFEAWLMAGFEALPEGARAAAAALATWGHAVEPARIPALDLRATGEAQEALLAAGLARRDELGRLALSPPALGERVLASLAAPARRALHRAAADWPGLTPTERFDHLAGAGDARGALAAAALALAEGHDDRVAAAAAALAEAEAPSLAGEWHARAGRELAARGRYARAIPHVERALALATEAAARFERWHQLSTCYLRVGRLADLEPLVREALQAAPPPGAAARLLSNESARLGALGDREGAREHAVEALGRAEEAGDDEAVGIAANTLARALLALGDHARADALAERAGGAYRRAGHGLGEVRALGTRAAVAQARQLAPETERLYLEAIETARAGGYRLVLEELLLSRAPVLMEAGRWEEFRKMASEAARITLEDERPSGAAIALTFMSLVDGLTGRPAAAGDQGRAAVRLTRRHQPDFEPAAWRSLAQAHRIAGRSARAERCARHGLSLAMKRSNPFELEWGRIELGRIWSAAGRWKEARDLWERALAAPQAAATSGRAVIGALAGRAALREGDPGQAARRLEACDDWLAEIIAPYPAAIAQQLRAEIALAERRVREGVDHARRALAAFDALPAPAERALAALEFARLALPAGSDSRLPVGGWLDGASATFERLGDRRSRERVLMVMVDWLRRTGGRPTVVDRDRNLIESVGRLLNSLPELGELTQRAMELAVEQFDAERGVLLLADPEDGHLVPMAEHGAVDASTRRDAMTYSRRVVERVTKSGGSVLIADAPSDPRAASDSVLDLRLRSIVCVPMYLAGRVVGAVYMDDSRRPDAFSDADRGLLEGFAHLMAVAIENSRGHEEVVRANEVLVGENLSLRQAAGARFQTEGLIGSSSAMQQVVSYIERAARTNTTVLITGENGTGKELIARILHHGGKRRLRPFVPVNCGAIPQSLIESELFGILPQTATDVRGRDGKFVLADGGTLFLDEIGAMPLDQQVALLSAIASREVTPVGGSKPIPVDVRIIAATNSDLKRGIEEGRFREDLYYRLNVIPIDVPPLRERKADIPNLARHFVAHFARQQERAVPDLSPEFLAALMQSDWPGNVRELQNYVERVLAMTPGGTLRPNPPPGDLEERGTTLRLGRNRGLTEMVEGLERRLVGEALQKARGNQSVAARTLGMTEQSLRYRMRKYGLPGPRQILRVRRNLR
jgi:transcriptional regulator with GAF, ATPase, and Fis domain/tetratricopeptide (TPR) repeat protein